MVGWWIIGGLASFGGTGKWAIVRWTSHLGLFKRSDSLLNRAQLRFLGHGAGE